jgi:hypothetical protein
LAIVKLFAKTLLMAVLEDTRLGEQEKFWREIFSDYCPKCPNTCCDAVRHLIQLRSEDDDSLFSDHRVPIYRWSDLNPASFRSWITEESDTIFLSCGELVQQGAILEVPENMFSGVVTLSDYSNPTMVRMVYSDRYCPLYDKDSKSCRVHEDSRRPYCCKHYPLVYPNERGGEPDSLLLNESCY